MVISARNRRNIGKLYPTGQKPEEQNIDSFSLSFYCLKLKWLLGQRSMGEHKGHTKGDGGAFTCWGDEDQASVWV